MKMRLNPVSFGQQKEETYFEGKFLLDLDIIKMDFRFRSPHEARQSASGRSSRQPRSNGYFLK
jgi:hypothetical protein